jgi:hypothetical protein
MATRYWVGGSGTWDTTTTTNWSTASNGAGGASAPTSADNVIIDTSSGTGTITCTAGVCNNLTVTATQAIILGAASSTLSVYGSLTFPSGGSFSASTNSWTLTFAGTTTGLTITTNGKSLSTIIFNGVGGGWTLGSALTTTVTITLTNGTFDTSSSGNYPVSIGTQISLGVGTKTLNLNASTVTFTGGNFYLYFDTNSTGFTFNAGTSQINFTGLNCNFFGGGFTFYNVSFTSNGGINIQMTGTNTFNNLLFTNRIGANYSTFNLGNNITVNGTLTLSTTSTGVSRLFVYTPTVGTQSTITLNGTLASMSDVDFRDIVAAGTAGTWSGTRIGNCLNNSNITFSTPKTVYWNLAGSQSWLGTTSGWATTSTGIPALTNFPLPQDTATFTEAGSAGTINLGAPVQIGNIQMADGISNRVSPFTLNMDTGGAVIYGSVTFFSGLTMTGTNTVTFSGQGITQNITNAGVTWTAPITVNNPTGTYKLLDNETLGSTLTFTLTAGTVNLNSKTLTTGLFSSSNSNIRSLLMGSGTLTLSGTGTVWNAATSTNFILIPGTGKISLTSVSAKTFAGGGASYPTLSQDGLGTLTITGSNRFYKITNSVQPTTITFTAGTNTTVDVWAVSGAAGSLVTVNSSAASNFGLIKVPSGEPVVSNYLAIQYSTATPSSGTWYAGTGSTNSGFNSGWIFTGIPYQNLAGRLYNTGNLLLANTSIFNEYVQNNISIQAYEMFAGQLDEFTGAGIVDPSLVLWLDAGQTASYPGTGTTWYDLSGRNNNGTLVNAPTYTANTAVGGTFNFNGTTQYVSLPTFNLAYGSSWTINAWVNWTGATPFTSGGAYPMIFSDNGNDGILLFGINTTNRPGVDVGFNIYSSGETFNNQTVTANSWYNVVATSGQGFLTIYVNGQLVISGTTTGFIGFANGAWIGNGANFGNSNWQGYISAVSVYNRVLAINEIVANYNALAKRYSATPIANNIIPARMVGPGTMLINGQFDEYTGIS